MDGGGDVQQPSVAFLITGSRFHYGSIFIVFPAKRSGVVFSLLGCGWVEIGSGLFESSIA